MRVGLLICFSIWASATAAQTAPKYPRKEVEYLAADNRKLPSAEGADHRIERTYRDSVSGTERRYNAAGKLVSSTPYARFFPAVRYGAELHFFDDGKIKTKTEYKGNKRNGDVLVHYPSGQVKRRETYRDDVRQTGDCFAEDGSPVAFYEFETWPAYQGGGLKSIIKAIEKNVRYPRMAYCFGIEGKVYVSFVVSALGEVEQAKVVKGVNGLDEAAVAAIKKLDRFTPGTQDGKPVPVTITTPIIFKLSRPVGPAASPNQAPDDGLLMQFGLRPTNRDAGATPAPRNGPGNAAVRE